MTAQTRKAGLRAVASVLALGLLVRGTEAAAQAGYGPPQGYPPQDYPSQGYPPQGYPPQGYQQPPPGYDQPPYGYDQRQSGYGQPPPGYSQPPSGYGQPQAGYDASGMPPPGQYVPPPGGGPEPSSYDPAAQQYDQDYSAAYQQWASRYCVDQRNQNTAAGAIIGGALGALLGAGVAGHHNQGVGALAGGALGATTGAVIGSNSGGGGACPPNYVVAPGAPAFYYSGPAYGPAVAAPGWYHPWVYTSGRWAYRPYRSWYWTRRGYGSPGYREPYRGYYR
jgi:hypothetical protein